MTLVGMSSPLAAQGAERSNTKGFMLGVGLNGSSIKFEDDDQADKGSGATLQLGYGFNRRFTLFIDLSGVVLDGDQGDGEVTLAQAFLGGRFNFGNAAQRWIPFADVGLGARGVGQNDAQFCDVSGCSTSDVLFSGGAFMFGGGVSFYATRSLAITGSLHWGVGEFSDVTVDNVTVSGFETDATTGRFNLGISWYPKR